MEKKFGNVIHLGIVVEDIHKAVEIYEKYLGIGPWEINEHSEFFADKIVNGGIGIDFANAMCSRDGFEIELIAPNGPGVFADWLKEHGPSLHHVKLQTDQSYEEVLAMAEEVSGRKPYLEIKWGGGEPIVAYADMLKETGLLLEIGKE